MKHKILLADESLTVQKVVALTLDKAKYNIVYARTRPEVIKGIVENPPKLILVSDTFSDVHWQSFPMEVEAWLGRDYDLPSVVLITSQEIPEAKHYAAVLKKPFTPQMLQSLVSVQVNDEDDRPTELIPRKVESSNEDEHLERAFNQVFSNEDELVRETFQSVDSAAAFSSSQKRDKEPEESEEEPVRRNTASPLWEVNPMKQDNSILGTEDSMVYKAALENRVEHTLENSDLESMVERILSRMMPSIVERAVQERLEQLLKEQETGVTL